MSRLVRHLIRDNDFFDVYSVQERCIGNGGTDTAAGKITNVSLKLSGKNFSALLPFANEHDVCDRFDDDAVGSDKVMKHE